ncbi:helix-turn-helix domain-containing protein [Nostoc sp. DedQUE09]|uniref:helix-turn-helix domain-containing protein n=1 Tax=Nostoc sp. DedQUE09 TaxID=3075394 RepID=UPI002AD26E08|nr:helix-turn-helix domain-containing protein [Nostoc sp. DedQUE09]MDZ7955687.1 helix-turn-helix domain-containing protein [Nostoc sp. DedQUE09]
MGSRLRVFLTREQDKTLLNLRTADVPQKVKDRAEVIRLSAHGWYVEKIAAHFNWTAQTVREVLHRWEKLGLEGLWEKPGRGGKSRWVEADMVFLEECLELEPRTYRTHLTS